MDIVLSYLNPFNSIIIGALLPYIPHALKIPVVHNKLAIDSKTNKTVPRGYDLKDPRSATNAAIDTTEQGKFIARCNNCHYNGFESFPLFAIAVLSAHVAGVDKITQQQMSTLYIIMRLIYTYVYCYGTNKTLAMLRSTVWAIGLGSSVYLLYKAGQTIKA